MWEGLRRRIDRRELQSKYNETIAVSAVSSRSYLCLMIFSKVMKQIFIKSDLDTNHPVMDSRINLIIY